MDVIQGLGRKPADCVTPVLQASPGGINWTELDLNPWRLEGELDPSNDIPPKRVDDSFPLFSQGKIEIFPFACGLTGAIAEIDLEPV